MAEIQEDGPRQRLDIRWLRFTEPALETAYRAAQEPGDLKKTRIAITVGVLLNAGFGIIDASVLTRNVELALFLRIGVATAVLLALVGLTFIPAMHSRLRLIATTGVVAYTAIYAALVAVAAPPDVYVAGYAIIVFILYVFLPVGYVIASTAGWLCTLGFAVVMVLTRPLTLDAMAIIGVQFLAANAVGMFSLYWMDRFSRQDFLNLDRIDTERRRHRNLLNRVLPESIANRLARGEAQIADTVEAATVLFADVVDFTGLTANCPSAGVVAFLDRLFADFDHLAAQHGVEKIKTIGDSYMAAAGLTELTGDHAERTGRLALDMLEVAKQMRPDGKPLQIRIGLCSGPVVAGVIGDKRFLYDVWGETVNLAQRLEAHGKPGRIQVTDAFRTANADRFAFAHRGMVDLKGTGAVDVWYLTQGSSPLAADTPE